ncbi:restriction endonuclease subunit S [Streptomyces sp. SID3343]|uniref:restriction endonuclease subunit S n=1 Tax=Streptomyces sp. SID3343 TaxID=2690260 RepID=UPI00136B580F|nr:restriction endonuclease subunit S [Streptomyces sp. SID3343]MYV98852.1 restriction endonuclease subunit S [Streptomyces sp. SID3343]
MTEWRTYQVGDIAQVFDGPHATPKKTKEGPWFLSISSLDRGRLDLSESAHVSEEEFVRWTRRVIPESGDILFSYETRLGDAALMPGGIRACLGRRMGILRPKRDVVIPEFLLFAYLAPSFQETIRSRKIHGATVDRIPLVDLPKWPIRIPELAEQRDIAAVLGALNDKIAVNDRVITASIDVCQALYASISKAAIETSELGSVIDLRYGKSLPSVKRKQGSVPVYGSGGIAGSHDEILVPGPGVIVGRKGTVGAIYWSQESFFPIDTTFYVSLKRSEIPMEYMYFALQDLKLERMNSDSAVPGLNRTNALATRLRVPATHEASTFVNRVRPLFELKHQRDQESLTLAALRETLLPQLMSGKLRVRAAERIVEDAV